MKTKLLTLLLGALGLTAAFADSVNLVGDTTNSPAFNRPTEAGSPSLFFVPYNVYQFSVASSGPFTFTLSAVDPSSYDTFLHLFAGSFNPLDASATFLAGNDDRDINDTNLGSGLTNISLSAGTTYFFVVDGFGATDAGPYTATISGASAITVVPEPSSFGIIGCGLLSLVGLMRWKTRRRHP